jgi:hypothetical protein
VKDLRASNPDISEIDLNERGAMAIATSATELTKSACSTSAEIRTT